VARMAGRCQRSQHGRTHQDRSWSPIESKNTLNSEGEGAKSGLVWVERERETGASRIRSQDGRRPGNQTKILHPFSLFTF
jgi:hypothetical protein